MSQFLYFLPIPTAPADAAGVRKMLDSFRLSHVHDARAVTTRKSKGPGGVDGLVCAFDLPADTKDPHKVPLYKPDQQTWSPIHRPDEPDPSDQTKCVHVGYWNDAPPTPDELRRKRFIRGIDVEMLDGQKWTVPVAVSMTGLGTLPKRMQLGEDGKSWKPSNLPEFMKLCDEAAEVFNLLRGAFGTGTYEFEWDWAMAKVVLSLSVNYRVSAAELSLLGCVTDATIDHVFKAVCDWAAFVQACVEQSKNESASAPPATDSGVEATSADTSPPSAT